MFSKFQYKSEKLPATKSTLSEKTLISHYTSLVWKSAYLPSPVLTDSKDFGWRWNSSEKLCELIVTKNLPAPESVIELCICKYKTGSTSIRCKCKKKTGCYVRKCIYVLIVPMTKMIILTPMLTLTKSNMIALIIDILDRFLKWPVI